MGILSSRVIFLIMPTYSYQCEKCNCDFELFFYIKDYIDNPKCKECSSSATYRDYTKDVLTQSSSVKKADSELKTIGDLANRNRDRLSQDEKIEIHKKHNEYKEHKEETPLPTGMTRMKKGQKTIWPT